jgi:hypothetical protein
VYLSGSDGSTAVDLIAASVRGEKWTRRDKGRRRVITDREMVDIAKATYFWVEIAYRFGCGLIHLSNLHDYKSIDPFTTIPSKDRQIIISFLQSHHGYRDNDIDFQRFIPQLPKVMKKIHGKVADYCSDLEKRRA